MLKVRPLYFGCLDHVPMAGAFAPATGLLLGVVTLNHELGLSCALYSPASFKVENSAGLNAIP